ncbi:hypothetical protein [[Eubacterium] cellulosolvens]
MDRLQLTIALDQNFSEKELTKISENLGGAFELKDRTYILKATEDKPPTAVFALGNISEKNLPSLLGVIKSEYWKKAAKNISKILGKRRRGDDPLTSFECSIESLRAYMRCKTSNRKVIQAIFEHLDSALEYLWYLVQKEILPSSNAQIYLGFHEKSGAFRIDRAVVLQPDFAEYEFDEKDIKWNKIGVKDS